MAAPGSNLKINGERLWDSLMEMAKIGPGVKGGNRRLTLTDVDREGRTMDESFRTVFTNAGHSARTVTVREHPSRWRTWTVASSSQKPAETTPDTLVFHVDVPAHGKATLDYAVRYTWTADTSPQ